MASEKKSNVAGHLAEAGVKGGTALVDNGLEAGLGAAAESKAGEAIKSLEDKYMGGDAQGVDWTSLLAPLPEKMYDRLPGHETLQLPNQTQLILQRKMEAGAAILSAVTDLNIDSPNSYVVRQRNPNEDGSGNDAHDGVALFVIQQVSAPASTSGTIMEYLIGKAGCKGCIKGGNFVMNVTDSRTGEHVAVIEAPPSYKDDFCGLVCCACCCCPVCACNSMRKATWTTVPKDGEQPLVLAKVEKKPLYNPCCCLGDCVGGDCCNTRLDVTYPTSTDDADGNGPLPLFLYKDCCDVYRKPWLCITCQCSDSELVILDESGIADAPKGAIDGPSSTGILGKIFGNQWQYLSSYKPTEPGNPIIEGRYPPLPTEPTYGEKSPTKEELLKASKEAASSITGGGSYLMEIPRNHAQEKIGLITGNILYDMIWGDGAKKE
jgi:hypothetical protein